MKETDPAIRTPDQSARMWCRLRDIAEQLPWPVDGRMQKLTAEDFKHILSAGLKKDQRIAAGIDGGFVILGQYTHKMSRAEMAEFIDFITAFGATREPQIVWSDPTAIPDEAYD